MKKLYSLKCIMVYSMSDLPYEICTVCNDRDYDMLKIAAFKDEHAAKIYLEMYPYYYLEDEV